MHSKGHHRTSWTCSLEELAARPHLLAVFALVATTLVLTCTDTRPGPVLLADRFDRPDGLISNSRADDPGAASDPVWRVTSGSLFARRQAAWSGPVDSGRSDPASGTSTGSAVLRIHTRADDFADVEVALRLRIDRLVSTDRTPPQAWDGVHLWLRYRSPQKLYSVSVARRDGTVALKKKCPGGPSNGGTYYTLASAPSHRFDRARWVDVGASAVNERSGVRLRLIQEGRAVLDVVDRGEGCPPLRAAGAIGVRGDNAEMAFDDVTVRAVTP